MDTFTKLSDSPTDGYTCELLVCESAVLKIELTLFFRSCRLTVGFVEAGGCVPEKFNAVEGTSNIDAEYGNQVSFPRKSVKIKKYSKLTSALSLPRVPISLSFLAKVSGGESLPPFARSFRFVTLMKLERFQDERELPSRSLDDHSISTTSSRRSHSS